ncbi:MAG: hypothetical protein ACKPKO_37035, partial [Candidatus Fonsibacter sp.]
AGFRCGATELREFGQGVRARGWVVVDLLQPVVKKVPLPEFQPKLDRCIKLEFGQWDLFDYWLEQVHYHPTSCPDTLTELTKLRRAASKPRPL